MELHTEVEQYQGTNATVQAIGFSTMKYQLEAGRVYPDPKHM